MRNRSLEQFNHKIRKKIALLGGYLEDKNIVTLICSCRLKPLRAFSNNFDFDTVLENFWVDEFNNLLEIKNKKLKIKWNATDVHKITTDIYRNESIKFIAEHSKSALIGLDQETKNCILLLTGTDNYFRCYNIRENNIEICSPLTIGIKILYYYINNKSAMRFKKSSIKSDIKELSEIKWFITPLPANQLLAPHIVTFNKLRSILDNE